MINKLNYYYNLNKPYIIKYKNKNYIKSENKLYLLYEIDNKRNKQEIIEAYELTKKYAEYEKVVLNKNNTIFTIIDGKTFILIKKNYSKKYKIQNRIVHKEIKWLDKSNWITLWKEKIDYIEKIYKNIKGKYIVIDESINYIIGMAEVAICYLVNNSTEQKERNLKYICRKNYDESEYYNPLNVVIDYPEREISEMLKKIFWDNESKNEKAIQYLRKNTLNYDPICVYARLLFPNFYLNEYINSIKYKKLKKIRNIINRLNEYEQYTKLIYNILNEKEKIPKINWL